MALYPLELYGIVIGIGACSMAGGIFLKKKSLFLLPAIALGMMIALVSAQRVQHVTQPSDVETFADGSEHEIHGWIVEDPDVRPTVTKLVIGIDAVDDKKSSGRVLVNQIGGWPPFRYGNEVTVYGKLTKPEMIEDFDYPHYLELRGIRALMNRGSLKAVNSDTAQPGNVRTFAIFGYLYEFRKIIEDQIGLILPEPHASLLAGLLTGSRRGLPENLSGDFRIAGITHIIAVSGYNITMIMTLLGGCLFWLPLKKRFWPLVLMVTAFTIFVGAGAPVVRAAIMGILGLIALQAERLTMPRLTILWTAFIMLMWNPLSLWYDASFQLSFLAVIGIMELTPYLKPLLQKAPEAFAIRESLITTLAAQIGTLPVSIILFHQLSLISPVTNILVAPLVPLAMLVGSIGLLLSFLWMPIALVVSYVAWAILQLIMFIGHFGAMVPLASITF